MKRRFFWFAFIPALKVELEAFQQWWNTHQLRKTKSADCPGGIPEDLYTSTYDKQVFHECGKKTVSELMFCMPTVLMTAIAMKVSMYYQYNKYVHLIISSVQRSFV